MKKTKIVCTIGPASDQPQILKKLIENGMNVARLNFSHGSYESSLSSLKKICAVAKKMNQPIGIMQDLQGPRFRIGFFDCGKITIKNNEKIILISETDFKNQSNLFKNKKFIPLKNISLYKKIKSQNIILIDDGLISLKVISNIDEQITTKVICGGDIKPNKGINFPGVDLALSALTDKDKKDALWGIKNNVDFIAFSFVHSAKDVIELRNLITASEKKQYKQTTRTTRTKIIAKIETIEAIKNFDEILHEADGIMVARGDLGIETNLERVPLLQKEMIAKCNKLGKIVIVATQMLESMVNNPMPTRAEVSDVANAILDGTDAVMLSAESATGKYPIQAVSFLNKIARNIEPILISKKQNNKSTLPLFSLREIPQAISLAINHIICQIKIDAIVCATTSGFTPKLIARFKPNTSIIALTNILKTQNQLSLSWGVESYLIPDSFYQTFDDFIKNSIIFLKKKNKIKKGQTIIFTMDYPLTLIGETNTIKVHKVE
ncbi:MAG: pyruvate kinase [Patescibacteria group bacterium]